MSLYAQDDTATKKKVGHFAEDDDDDDVDDDDDDDDNQSNDESSEMETDEGGTSDDNNVDEDADEATEDGKCCISVLSYSLYFFVKPLTLYVYKVYSECLRDCGHSQESNRKLLGLYA